VASCDLKRTLPNIGAHGIELHGGAFSPLVPLGMIEHPPRSKGGHDLANPVRVDNMALSHYPWSLAVVPRGFVCLLYGLFERPRLWFLEILVRGRYPFSTPNQNSWGRGVDIWHFATVCD
jgi:hypothetical protein